MKPSPGAVTSEAIEQEYLRNLLLWVLGTHFPKIVDDLVDNVLSVYKLAHDSSWQPEPLFHFEQRLQEWQERYSLTDDWITARIKVVLQFWLDNPSFCKKRVMAYRDDSKPKFIAIEPPDGLPEFGVDYYDVDEYVEQVSETAHWEISKAMEDSAKNFLYGVLSALPPVAKSEMVKAIADKARRYARRVLDANLLDNSEFRVTRNLPELETHFIWLIRSRCEPHRRLEDLGTKKVGENEIPSHPANVARSISILAKRMGMSKDSRRKRGVIKGTHKSIIAKLGRNS